MAEDIEEPVAMEVEPPVFIKSETTEELLDDYDIDNYDQSANNDGKDGSKAYSCTMCDFATSTKGQLRVKPFPLPPMITYANFQLNFRFTSMEITLESRFSSASSAPSGPCRRPTCRGTWPTSTKSREIFPAISANIEPRPRAY